MIQRKGDIVLSKEKVIRLAYNLIDEINPADNPDQKRKSFNKLEMIGYILNEDIPDEIDNFILQNLNLRS